MTLHAKNVLMAEVSFTLWSGNHFITVVCTQSQKKREEELQLE